MTVEIERYERLRPIGSGGFSQVYEAWEPDFDRRVAVKVLTVGNGQDVDRQAFQRECRAMGSVSGHPNIVTVFGSGFSQSGQPFISMELYHQTLLDRIQDRGYLPVDEVLDIGVQLAGALQCAHDAGILHRDIKPQNIFFSPYGDPALGDFGIASIAGDSTTHTTVGMSIHYAAPEVVEGGTPTVESDLYSLGATLYTALSGQRPFARAAAGDSRAELINRILTAPPPPITVQPIPAYTERAILGLLAKHPNDRPRSAVEVGNLLRDLQTRMGLVPTPLRVATLDLDDVTEPRLEAPPPRPVAIDFDDSSAVTSYRPQTVDRPTAEFAEPARDRRMIYAAAALIGVLAIATIGVVLSRGQDPGTSAAPSTTVTSPPSTTIIDRTPPGTPTALTQTPVDEGISISWTESERADRYQIVFTVGGDASILVDAPPHVLALPTTDTCLSVRAIGDTGQTSAPSEPICLER